MRGLKLLASVVGATPDISTWSWATVTDDSPLRVQLDGESAPLDVTPDTLVSGLAVDDRVWVQLVTSANPARRYRRLVVFGRSGGQAMGGWTAWNPTLTALTVGSGEVLAKYTQLDDSVMWRFKFTYGASGSAVGTDPGFTLPVTPHSDFVDTDVIGWGALRDAAPAQRVAVLRYMGSGNTRIFFYNATPTTASVTSTAPWTWASGDSMHLWGVYYT
jgi:hypothetical protein